MTPPPDTPVSDRRTLRITGIVFFLSGFSSLVYQVVWQRLLTLHYGVGAVSNAVIVGVFLAGLGLGGLIGGGLAERQRRLLRSYQVVELSIGAFGLASIPLLSVLGRHTAGSGPASPASTPFCSWAFPRFSWARPCRCSPRPSTGTCGTFVRTLSALYFVNTIGAAAGAVTASYLFISLLGLDGAVWIAAALNFAIAILVTSADPRPTSVSPPDLAPSRTTDSSPSQRLGRLALPVVVVTGFLGIGYEMTWLRVVGVLIKDTPYAFASVLFVYLLGIALGSLLLERAWARDRVPRPLDLFFSLQVATAVVVALSFIGLTALARSGVVSRLLAASWASDPLPFPFPPSALPATLAATYRFVPYTATFLWPLILVLAPTLLIGAGFPLVSSLALSDPDREGRTVGHVWFFSVVGNVLGAVVTAFVLLPLVGTERTLLAFILVGLAAVLVPAAKDGPTNRRLLRLGAFCVLATAAISAVPGPG